MDERGLVRRKGGDVKLSWIREENGAGRGQPVCDGRTLVGNVAYKPFGPAESMDLGPLALTRSYDQRYQVTSIQAGTVLNYAYTHDGAGNVETISGLPKPDFFPRLTDLTYAANRMATQNTDWIGAGVVLPSPAAVYSYDNAGNIVSDGLHTDYFYNQNNRLIRVEIDGLTVAEYAYDAFERRVLKVVNGVTTHFHYDLNGLLISETDGNGNPRKDYIYLNGEPVAMKTYGGSAGWYWFVNDHLGTPQKMVDESGSVVWAAAYAPFGEARVYADEITNNLRFPGQYYDVETGLHYNWHRYYDPGTGRYLTPDPIGLAGGINPYVYVQNNPINLTDPLGLMSNATWGQFGAGMLLVPAPGARIVGGVILAGVAGYVGWQYFSSPTPFYEAQGRGKQSPKNWATEQAKIEAQSTGKDPCRILDEMYKNECDKKKRQDIKQAQKFLKCRRSRWK